jgi:hypothetical protein
LNNLTFCDRVVGNLDLQLGPVARRHVQHQAIHAVDGAAPRTTSGACASAEVAAMAVTTAKAALNIVCLISRSSDCWMLQRHTPTSP